jgi:hypothetical protein
MMMTGGAPTPPQGARPMMVGQLGPSMASKNTHFKANHPFYHQIVTSGPINGTGQQPRLPISTNGYMMHGQIMPQGQQPTPYIGQMLPQHRQPINFGAGSSQV